MWMQRLQGDLLNNYSLGQTLIYEDDQFTICMAKNPQYHERVKYIDIKFHYLREQVEMKNVKLEYCSNKDIIADVLTKGLLSAQFMKPRKLFGVKE